MRKKAGDLGGGHAADAAHAEGAGRRGGRGVDEQWMLAQVTEHRGNFIDFLGGFAVTPIVMGVVFLRSHVVKTYPLEVSG